MKSQSEYISIAAHFKLNGIKVSQPTIKKDTIDFIPLGDVPDCIKRHNENIDYLFDMIFIRRKKL